MLLHTAIGRNEDPGSKCEDFRRVLDQLQGRLDVALFKFCYIDFNDGRTWSRYSRRIHGPWTT